MRHITPGRGSLRRPLTLGFVAAGLVPLVLAVGLVGLRSEQDGRTANALVADRLAAAVATNIQAAFSEWSNELLVAAQDDVLKQWYRTPSRRTSLKVSVDALLVGVHRLYPDLIDEACYIDRGGQEEARQVNGFAVAVGDLSPDESHNPFFTPTFALADGLVHQHQPYVSPDSHSWVISNSTPIVVNGRAVAILHFETELEALRKRIQKGLPAGTSARIVDTSLGIQVMDTRTSIPLPKGAPDQSALPKATSMVVPPHMELASATVPGSATNQNHWSVQVLSRAAPLVSTSLVLELGGLVLVVLVGLLVAASVATRRLVGPLRSVTDQAQRLAAGDLTGRLSVDRDDELGRMAEAVNAATEQLSATVESIRSESAALMQVASTMDGVGQELTDQARSSDTQTSTMSETAAGLGHVVDTVERVVTDIETAVGEIAARASEAGAVAAQGAALADETTGLVAELVAASEAIGDVVRAITAVTEQTRMLSLNATIEAARAGEHGRGFGVVAKEVKDLAEQTAKATDQIADRVETVRRAALGAAEAIERIGTTITQVDGTQSRITDVVGQQTELAREMRSQVEGLSHSSVLLTASSAGVVQAASASRHGAEDTTRAASSLNATARRMHELVASFTLR